MCPDFNLNSSSEKRVSVYIRLRDATTKGVYSVDSYTTVHVLGQPHLKQLTAHPCITAAGTVDRLCLPSSHLSNSGQWHRLKTEWLGRATEEFCLKRTENAGKTCSRDFNQNFSLNDVVPKGICCTLSTYDMHLSLLGILNSQRRSICSLYSPYFIITMKKKEEDLR